VFVYLRTLLLNADGLLDVLADLIRTPDNHSAVAFARAGPRDYIVWEPDAIKACIVTCGGLCPGLNDVIQEIVQILHCEFIVL